jgi:Transposase DDE domain
MEAHRSVTDENWNYVLGLLPSDWAEQAKSTGAVQRLRGASSVGNLLRALLLHIGHGCSLRTASVVGKAAGWINMSDVALHKKLTLCEPWLHQLCRGLLTDSQMKLPVAHKGLRMRLVDSTLIKEPGATGSQWRVLYSLRVPDWQCDHFRLSPTKGVGNGESLKHFAVQAGDCLLADRGFSHLAGIKYVQTQGGHVIVRLHEQNTPLETVEGKPVDVLRWLSKLKKPLAIGGLPVWVRPSKGATSSERVPARLCAVRKSVEAAVLAKRKLRRRAQRRGEVLRDLTVAHADWVVILTTVPEAVLADAEVLEWYRLRWQIELAFKRLKSLGDVGHLPKSDQHSSRAWIYGKLLIALLTEKMQRHAASFSPWGGRWLDQDAPPEPLA